MVNLLSLALLACWCGPGPLDEGLSTPDDPTRAALSKGRFPWYDPKSDTIRPVELRRSESESESTRPVRKASDPSSPTSFFGDAISLIFLGVGLAVLIGLLVWLWRNFEPVANDVLPEKKKSGEPNRIDTLPPGMDNEFATSDPWEEALRRRNRGDFAGAIICLFAHQLLTLSKLGLVRLAPGRTGRQLVRAVTDSELRTLIHPTLGLFEVVYYGHRVPTEAEFTEAWTLAEAFERRVASGVVR